MFVLFLLVSLSNLVFLPRIDRPTEQVLASTIPDMDALRFVMIPHISVPDMISQTTVASYWPGYSQKA